MNRRYEYGREVPNEILCKRLSVLATAVTVGKKGIDREFYMSIPARVENDADLVISEAGRRIKELTEKNNKLSLQLSDIGLMPCT